MIPTKEHFDASIRPQLAEEVADLWDSYFALSERVETMGKRLATQLTKQVKGPVVEPMELRIAQVIQAVSRHEADGTPATLGTLKKRNGFEQAEVERLARLFPGKLALKESRNPKGGPFTKIVTLTTPTT